MRKKYDESFKNEAVNIALNSDLSYSEIARDLGVNYQTFGNWMRLAMNQKTSNKTKTVIKKTTMGLESFIRKRFKRNHIATNSCYADNKLNQLFDMPVINLAWVTDITYIRIKQQWLYLAIVMDLYSRQIIGWSMSYRIDSQLIIDALKMALLKRGKPKNVILHSDRGSQYCSKDYQQLLLKKLNPRILL